MSSICSVPSLFLFFFHTPSPPDIYTLSLHDALPISLLMSQATTPHAFASDSAMPDSLLTSERAIAIVVEQPARHRLINTGRSEEHTSELQSHHDLVCRLLLEKKKKKNIKTL